MLARLHGVLHGLGHRRLPWPLRAADAGHRRLEQDVNLGQFGTHPCTLSPASVGAAPIRPAGYASSWRPAQPGQLVTSAEVNFAQAMEPKITA